MYKPEYKSGNQFSGNNISYQGIQQGQSKGTVSQTSFKSMSQQYKVNSLGQIKLNQQQDQYKSSKNHTYIDSANLLKKAQDQNQQKKILQKTSLDTRNQLQPTSPKRKVSGSQNQINTKSNNTSSSSTTANISLGSSQTPTQTSFATLNQTSQNSFFKDGKETQQQQKSEIQNNLTDLSINKSTNQMVSIPSTNNIPTTRHAKLDLFSINNQPTQKSSENHTENISIQQEQISTEEYERVQSALTTLKSKMKRGVSQNHQDIDIEYEVNIQQQKSRDEKLNQLQTENQLQGESYRDQGEQLEQKQMYKQRRVDQHFMNDNKMAQGGCDQRPTNRNQGYVQQYEERNNNYNYNSSPQNKSQRYNQKNQQQNIEYSKKSYCDQNKRNTQYGDENNYYQKNTIRDDIRPRTALANNSSQFNVQENVKSFEDNRYQMNQDKMKPSQQKTPTNKTGFSKDDNKWGKPDIEDERYDQNIDNVENKGVYNKQPNQYRNQQWKNKEMGNFVSYEKFKEQNQYHPQFSQQYYEDQNKYPQRDYEKKYYNYNNQYEKDNQRYDDNKHHNHEKNIYNNQSRDFHNNKNYSYYDYNYDQRYHNNNYPISYDENNNYRSYNSQHYDRDYSYQRQDFGNGIGQERFQCQPPPQNRLDYDQQPQCYDQGYDRLYQKQRRISEFQQYQNDCANYRLSQQNNRRQTDFEGYRVEKQYDPSLYQNPQINQSQGFRETYERRDLSNPRYPVNQEKKFYHSNNQSHLQRDRSPPLNLSQNIQQRNQDRFKIKESRLDSKSPFEKRNQGEEYIKSPRRYNQNNYIGFNNQKQINSKENINEKQIDRYNDRPDYLNMYQQYKNSRNQIYQNSQNFRPNTQDMNDQRDQDFKYVKQLDNCSDQTQNLNGNENRKNETKRKDSSIIDHDQNQVKSPIKNNKNSNGDQRNPQYKDTQNCYNDLRGQQNLYNNDINNKNVSLNNFQHHANNTASNENTLTGNKFNSQAEDQRRKNDNEKSNYIDETIQRFGENKKINFDDIPIKGGNNKNNINYDDIPIQDGNQKGSVKFDDKPLKQPNQKLNFDDQPIRLANLKGNDYITISGENPNKVELNQNAKNKNYFNYDDIPIKSKQDRTSTNQKNQSNTYYGQKQNNYNSSDYEDFNVDEGQINVNSKQMYSREVNNLQNNYDSVDDRPIKTSATGTYDLKNIPQSMLTVQNGKINQKANPKNGNHPQYKQQQRSEQNPDLKVYECREGCGRSFNSEALPKHEKVCKKVFQQKRKQFNSAAMRTNIEELNQFNGFDQFQPQKQTKHQKKPVKQQNNQNIQNSGDQNKNTKPKWLKQSEAFRAVIKSTKSNEVPDPKTNALISEGLTEDYVPCNFCGRKFNEHAAKRHIPFCEKKAKENQVKGPSNKQQQNNNQNSMHNSKLQQKNSSNRPQTLQNTYNNKRN